MKSIKDRVYDRTTKTGMQTLKVSMKVTGSPQQKTFINLLDIINNYEQQVRKQNRYYQEPLKTILKELNHNKKMIFPSMMPKQTAGAQFLIGIIQAHLKDNPNAPEEEQRAVLLLREELGKNTT